MPHGKVSPGVGVMQSSAMAVLMFYDLMDFLGGGNV